VLQVLSLKSVVSLKYWIKLDNTQRKGV
jgi:hypothetical protein